MTGGWWRKAGLRHFSKKEENFTNTGRSRSLICTILRTRSNTQIAVLEYKGENMKAMGIAKAVVQYGQKIYYSFKQYLKSFYDSERLWADRHLHQGEEWIMSYWDSRDHPHRKLLLKKIEAYAPISSILEVGCCCGVNLALFSQRFPDAVIRGIEINSKAVEN